MGQSPDGVQFDRPFELLPFFQPGTDTQQKSMLFEGVAQDTPHRHPIDRLFRLPPGPAESPLELGSLFSLQGEPAVLLVRVEVDGNPPGLPVSAPVQKHGALHIDLPYDPGLAFDRQHNRVRSDSH